MQDSVDGAAIPNTGEGLRLMKAFVRLSPGARAELIRTAEELAASEDFSSGTQTSGPGNPRPDELN